MNYDDIAMRDLADASLMGAVDDDFGVEGDFEPDQFGSEDDFGVEFGEEDIFGVAAPQAPAAMVNHPDPRVRKILHHHIRRGELREARLRLLEPNRGSELKVERYTFGITAYITLATSGAIAPVSNSPDVNFRPQRVTMNVPSPGFILISDARVANVSFVVGGSVDAWQFNANAVGESLDVPTLTPANRATWTGSYTGLVPTPLSGSGQYTVIMAFTGPASIVA
jgi:hypothetical protein